LWNKDQSHTDEKKDKKKKSSAAKAGPTLPKHPAAHGLQLDEELNLVVPDNLKELVATRRQWVDKVGTVFDQMQEEHPGRILGFPQRSIYEGMEEEVREEIARTPKWKPILRPKPPPEPEVPAEVDAAAQAGDMDWLGAELGAELDADMEFV
jgi:transcriptional adapter 3